ncbi:MAG: ABC transporter ATP-binding protein [Ilumatobacteraceae bacterium]|nr:ABC transporter ATP-binding protein [Ilumatobacteraceae bacterium]
MTELLRLRDFSVSFDTPRGDLHAVRGVDLSVAKGESIGIVGESGSGKTVLSRATMGLMPSTATCTGSVEFNGIPLSDLSHAEVRNYWGTGMAMIFQDPLTSLNPVRRIGSQLMEGLIVRLGMSKDQARARSVELLERVRIPDPYAAMKKYPGELSGGMRQRIVIAIAIACTPELLFADEPTTALDVTVQAQVLELLAELRQEFNMTMILVTHDLGVVAGQTDRVVVMYAGEIVEAAATKDLFANMKMPYTEALMKSIPRLDQASGQRLRVITGRLPDPTTPEPGCSFAPRCEYATDKCRAEKPPLVTMQNGHQYRCFFPIGGSL